MADKEHLKLLEQGVANWNEWRKQHKEIRPDLNGAHLSYARLPNVNLSHANMRDVHLSYARLRGADLSHADLREARLSYADPSEANLSYADLREADLHSIDLSYARLPNADLSHTNLRGSHLTGANLTNALLINALLTATDFTGARLVETDWTNAKFGSTICGELDLRSVRGLETVKHEGPSTIGLDTIYLSRGQIPEIFLRRAGVPETFLTQMRALVESISPIDFYSCFISHSSQDQAFAERLYADLQSKGVRCWFATEDLKIGDKIRLRIDESIHLYDKLLLVLSEHSVTSQWVEQEVETALEKERKVHRVVLFPIRLDNVVMEMEGGWPALIRNTRNIGDFTCWKEHDTYQKAFERLMRDLKAETAQSEK